MAKAVLGMNTLNVDDEIINTVFCIVYCLIRVKKKKASTDER